ncbi:tyrosinase [Podospora aff. communis PSN243]|uniref:Tyrosinase n=1 Tax=Podospora aff. communis PSN243 TaxID=3040156 RepID=A0AAV9H1R6_9PEZI|nr:tyrosinase [Podospora aff. communis PSN243]
MAGKLSLWAAVLLLTSLVTAAPPPPRDPRQSKPIIRKEWRTLKPGEKKDYLKAQTMDMHFTGHFLPWHRYYTAVYERMLRDECGYKGAQPYWDWTLDTPASNFANSPVFDALTGFGGNGPLEPVNPNSPFPPVPGRTGGGCVVDGPFTGIPDLVHLGPFASVTYNPQCLKRDLSPYFAARYLALNQTQLTLSQPDFGWFARIVEGGPDYELSGVHGGGHYGVGGSLGQMGDLLMDISGPEMMMDYGGPNVTLAYPLSVGVSGADVTVGDVMAVRGCGVGGSVLCYDYDQLYTLA